jgi:hypothetical protein
MSRHTPGKRLQRLAQEELGMRPILGHCHNLMAAATKEPGHTMEEHVARVFEANRERLKTSAEQKATQAPSSAEEPNHGKLDRGGGKQ